MQITDKYGVHPVAADYFSRGDHIENDHIHFPTGVETHNIASDEELVAAVQGLEAQSALAQQEIDSNSASATWAYNSISTLNDEILTVSQGITINAGSITTNENGIGVNTGSITTANGVIDSNVDRLNATELILDLSTANILAKDLVQCDNLESLTYQNAVLAKNLQVAADDQNVPSNGLPAGLFFDRGACSERLSLLEDARVILMPSLDTAYRFGAADGEVNADRDEHDGLHMFQDMTLDNNGSRSALQPELNEIAIKVSKTIPTIEIISTKQANIPILNLVDNEGDPYLQHYQGELILYGRGDRNSTLMMRDPDDDPMFAVLPTGETYTYRREPSTLGASGTVLKNPAVMNGPQAPLLARACNDHTYVLMLFDNAQELMWGVTADGHVFSAHENEINAVGAQPAGAAPMVDSSAVGDESFYIGSTRLSYNRVQHRMEFHRLKLSHIPLYLQGRGLTSSNLPSGHVVNDMSAMKWVQQARAHFSEPGLTLHDVFPAANTGDWELKDAPADDMSADISTLETEMDAAEASLALKANKLNAVLEGQLALGKAVAEQGITIDIESSSDPHLQLTRTGFPRFLITRHSDGYLGFSVSNGSNAGQKFRIGDDGSITAYSSIDVPASSAHTVDGVDVVAVERARIDSILNLSSADLDTFKEIEDAYKAADSSLTTTVTNLQSSHTSDIVALDARLDTIEAVDYGTQAELNVEKARITALETADIALDGRLDTIEAIDYGTQAELDVEKARITALETTDASHTAAIDLKAPLAAADLTGSVGIGDPLKASGLGLTVHQSGQSESGISVYATGGNDAVLNLMENKGDFGHATNGGTGFRCMYDGGDNKFKIRSADDDTVNDRLTIERDSGDIVISGNINLAAGREFQVDGTALAKSDVGLGNVDNTADSAKPVSSAQQTALNLKSNLASPALTGDPTCPNQSSGDSSTKIANTAYVDAASGGTTYTILKTIADSSAASYRGELTTPSTYTARELTSSETDILVYGEAGYLSSAVELPELSTLSEGHTINITNLTRGDVYCFSNSVDTGNMLFGWQVTKASAGSYVKATDSYRVCKFIKMIDSNDNEFWFVVKFDSLDG